MKKLGFIVLLSLGGCSSFQTEVVKLRNADGTLVTCGPYKADLIVDKDMSRADSQLRACISDYQRAGYQRF